MDFRVGSSPISRIAESSVFTELFLHRELLYLTMEKFRSGNIMAKDGYYTSGEFARKANVTLRTIRYYDKQGILKPSKVNEKGYRYYTDGDFAKLQKILSLKYLGFSL